MPRRPALREISANRPIGHELKPVDRALIVGASKCGVSIANTAQRLNFNPNTVKTTLRRDSIRQDNKALTRTGRPLKASKRDVQKIIYYVRVNPKHTYSQIRKNLAPFLSLRTIKRILEPFNIKKWQCKKRPELSKEVANKRHNWVLSRKDWSTEEWACIIFSDETSVERGKGGQREWVFRTAEQKWLPKMVQTYKKGHDLSIMVWGAIWIGGRSDLVIMTRDDNTTANGYSANSYISVLEQALPRCWQPGMKFMQDKALIHTAKKVKKWPEESGISVIDWPPYSPDFNPIEHVWAKMKEWIHQHFSHLQNMGDSQEAHNELARIIVEAWEAIPQDYIDNLIKSMDHRVNAALAAEGWHTKY